MILTPYLNGLVPSEGVFLDRLSIVQIVIVQYRTGLFYPGGGAVVRLLCINLGSAAKRLKESDLVRDSTR
jgi:hypothetical protein